MGTSVKKSQLSKATQKKLQTQNMIIIALIIIIVVLCIVSGTAAWYIRTRSDSADIILSNPVNIYITEFEDMKDASGNIIYDKDGNPIKEHSLKTDILEQYNTKIYPGDKIKMNLGLQVGNQSLESSHAYVRVKLAVTYENIYTGEVSGLDEVGSNLIRYKDEPDPTVWERVDFNKFKEPVDDNPVEEDIWYVLKTYDSDGNIEAKISYNLEKYEFVNGYIELDKFEITNKHANCKFHINYVVEAIQVPNVPNPLKYEGYGPWWGFAKGDTDEIPGWESRY